MKAFILSFALPLLAAALPGLDTRSQYSKYKCMTLDKWEQTNVQCATNCENLAIHADGCAKDDFYCHCKRTQRIDDLIAPCMLTQGGVNATCSGEELGQFQASVTDLCKYFNATGYLPYATCPQLLW